MSGRSTIDTIFALRQITEKYRETQKEFYAVFIHLAMRSTQIWSIRQKGVVVSFGKQESFGGDYIGLFSEKFRGVEIKVKSNRGITNSFKMKVRVNPESTLSR